MAGQPLRTRTLLTDAYSTTNLGDAELVLRSIQAVEKTDVVAAILATDPESFAADTRFSKFSILPNPTSPVLRKQSGRLQSLATKINLGLTAALLATLALAPIPRTKRRLLAQKTVRLARMEWYQQLLTVDKVVAVGGGYLGDRYLRRTIISLGYLWGGGRLGLLVETMPLSISSADRLVTRRAISWFGKEIKWRAREERTRSILASCGISATYVPDLAWCNASPERSKTRAARVVVAPVGSDFYAETATKGSLIREIERSVTRVQNEFGTVEIDFVAMHSYSAMLQDGHDDEACVNLASRCTDMWPDIPSRIHDCGSYEEVLDLVSSATILISERMHAAIAGLSQGTATSIIAYEPKHAGIVRAAGMDVETGTDGVMRIADVAHIHAKAMRQRKLLETEFGH